MEDIWEQRIAAGISRAFERIFDNFHRDIELANSPDDRGRATNIFTKNFITLLETEARARKAIEPLLPPPEA
jgi:hypothetical protein